MSKWYGNVNNRIEEGKNYTGREIRVGDDITMYHYSDRTCYYVTEVIDQTHIKVRRWYTCADHSKEGGIGHQNWLYFRSMKEMHDYLSQFYPYPESNFEETDSTWVYRYNKWMNEYVVKGGVLENPEPYSERERKSFEKNGFLKVYSPLNGKVSFGVRDYYHDWEF